MIKKLIEEKFGMVIALILCSPILVVMVKLTVEWLLEVLVSIGIVLGYLLNLVGLIG